MLTFTVLVAHAVLASAQTTFNISNWQGYFAQYSGVLEKISPKSDTSFTFVPTDYFHLRNASGNYHTGDINLAWRQVGQSDWEFLSSAQSRDISPESSQPAGKLLHSNFNNVWPNASVYISVTRDWTALDGDLVLSTTVQNINNETSVEIGGLGFPIEMNNIFWNRSPTETTAKCVLVDPYIGLEAGYAQVTRLTGTGPNMVITPVGGNSSKFEAWQQLVENVDQTTGYQTVEFEGVQAWVTLSLAYAETDWFNGQPWNPPTSQILESGQSLTASLRFSLAQQVYDIEPAVSAIGLPVAVGLPGYVIPSDMNGQLFLKYHSTVSNISTSPAGALNFENFTAKNAAYQAYAVTAGAGAFGRVYVTITYQDGTVQAVHYFVTDTAFNTVSKYGDFLFNEQWYNDTSDVFNRAPSVISYDYSVGAPILQEYRAWIAGISDEAGAGSFEAAAMKSSIHPVTSQVNQLEIMVKETVQKWLQDLDTPNSPAPWSVKRSLFFYQPDAVPGYQYNPDIDFGYTWNLNASYSVWRAYDYVHVSALYWGLYRAERANPGVLTMQNSTYYLLQAYHTAMESQALFPNGTTVTYYGNDGLMCETVWLKVLEDLQAEGYTSQFKAMRKVMLSRQKAWASEADPFGSEMPWDSTGQEGVYMWSKYFSDAATVNKTINSIHGYMPTVAHWGYNGNARRYWDFTTGGKIAQVERMLHHYGSGLNALPILSNYMYYSNPSSPQAFYDLRIGYGGNMGPMTNINEDGFGSQAFHSYPDLLEWEAYSGDYGPNFLGHVLGATTILVDHPDFGWVAMGGNVVTSTNLVTVTPRDTVRRRIYVASAGLFVEFDAGQITQFSYNNKTGVTKISLATIDGSMAAAATMTFEDTLGSGVKLTTSGLKRQLGGYAVPIPSTVSFSR